ncbi:MAG: hypothetical protein NTV06_03345 [candidate division Zixibacteria bacterium]|nr:hypothetical protein [candidate division Zixibacteria bacterium]
MRELILRIIGLILLLALLIGGYVYLKKINRDELEKEYRRYTGVITETSIAAELYRNKKDSFLIARDSILRKYHVARIEMKSFTRKFKDDPQKWVELWKHVTDMTDSAVNFQDSLLAVRYKMRRDSVK